MKRLYIFAFALVVFTYLPVSATIINIPDDYPTIQEGIDASNDGDTVLVQPGTYVENINFNGHNIVLGSLFLTTGDTTYISETVIDGDSAGSVVIFESGEDSTAVITGFTIQNGYAQDGGGIYCMEANPIIKYNYIIQNVDDRYGGGIYCYISNPSVERNNISNNNGSGIFCNNNSHPLICSNIFDGNSGGGVRCKTRSNPVICHNMIINNTTYYNGGGIYCDVSSPVIFNNTISGNYSNMYGGGICLRNWSEPMIINSILWDDSSRLGQEIDGFSSMFEVRYCNVQGGYEGEGNIDADPLFRDPENGDFHLMSTECGDPYDSPCIDAGDPDILDSLLDCSWGLGTIASDMGAYGGGDSATVSIDNEVPEIPNRFALAQNYPNPFNTSTVIRYSLPEPSDVIIEIFDILGRRVQTLLNEHRQAGIHNITFDASELASGMYFYKLQAGKWVGSRRMVLLK